MERRIPVPRSEKCRMVCAEYKHKVFHPELKEEGLVTIQVDELEALRLCDLENLDQDEAAKKMNVSRGTFQRILYSARYKSAEALCEGKRISIGGGNYEVCGKCEGNLRCKRCILMQKEDNTNQNE